jgi:hypothetical protein
LLFYKSRGDGAIFPFDSGRAGPVLFFEEFPLSKHYKLSLNTIIAGGHICHLNAIPRSGNIFKINGVEQGWEVGEKSPISPPKRKIQSGLSSRFSEALFKRS